LLTRGTTIGLPLSTTLPVIPSPSLIWVLRARSSKPSTASAWSSPSRSSVTMPRTMLWWRMSVPSTRCIAAFRLSVPESAWLISSRVDRRRALEEVVDSETAFGAGIDVEPPAERRPAQRHKIVEGT
jgi:hypothetical protein